MCDDLFTYGSSDTYDSIDNNTEIIDQILAVEEII